MADYVRRRVPVTWTGGLTGLPAFVCASGSSLDVSIACLARVAHPGVVIAVDSAARWLARQGVSADFVVSLDASTWPEDCLADDAEPGRVVLASVSPPRWREQVRSERAFFLSSDQVTENWLAGRGVARAALSADASCGAAAIELARLLGCAPIVLFGVDAPDMAAGISSDLRDVAECIARLPRELVISVNDRGGNLPNAATVSPHKFSLPPTRVGKRSALSQLPLSEAKDTDAARAAFAALGAQGAQGCRIMSELRAMLHTRGAPALANELRRLLAGEAFAGAMGAFALELAPYLAAPVVEDTEPWGAVLDELEELSCLAEAVYEVSVG